MKVLTSTILLFLLFCLAVPSEAQEHMGLVIHGGAGNIKKEHMNPRQEQAYRQKLQEALNAGWNILETGGSSLEAVTIAIQILENSPLFNAGKGAVLTKEGKAELDASIMDGKTGLAGAVAAVTTIKNPILAAKAVMKHSPHVMLAGRGAEIFAQQQGLEIVPTSYFIEHRRLEQLRQIQEQEKKKEEGIIPQDTSKQGTVGAVALDKEGNLAAGTSTGGMFNKQFGRIGDSPIIGAGTYANNATCAVSATGHGEYFIRNVVAYDISALMEYKNMSLKEASNEVIMNKLKEKGGEGGVIAIDRNGNINMPFNTEGMFRGFIQKRDKPQVLLFKKE